jgi:DNA-binding NarL/FixJ family response regulator
VAQTSTRRTYAGIGPIGTDAAHVALVERDHAWKLAAQAIGSARAGKGSALLFEGAAGIGKSGLIAAIRFLAAQSGTELLTASGRRGEGEFPFGLVVQLMESRLDGADASGSGAGLTDLAGSEPSFDQLHRLYRLCARLAAASPLSVVIDDADLADPASLRFLLYLTERLAELPMAIILAARPVSRGKAPELLHELAHHPLTSRWRLEPLTENGTARRLAKMWLLGTGRKSVQEIHRASGGNAFLIDALAAALAEHEAEPHPTAVRELAPAGIADWAMGHAAELDGRAPALLSTVAVLGPDCELRHVSALANLDPEDAVQIVDGLREIGILAIGDGLRFSQPVVAVAIAAAMPSGALGVAHLRAARLLAADDASPEWVAGHLLGAARTGSGWAVDALCLAASVALGRGAPSDAVRYLRRALDEPPPKGNRTRVVLELGRAEAIAGEPQAAARLRDVAEHLTGPPEQPSEAVATGRALFALGRPQQALMVFERALENVTAGDSELAGRLRAGHATAVWVTHLWKSNKRQSVPAPVRADTPGDRALLALHAMEAALRGVPCAEVRALAERALAQGALLDDETADGLSYYLAAGALVYAEDLQTAEAALTAAVQDAQSRGSVLGFATASHMRALAILMRGRLPDAAMEARHALAVERHGWRFGLGGARVVLATTLIERGDLGRARSHLDAAEAAAGDSDPFRLSLLVARGRLRLLRGQPNEALDDFLACGALADRAGVTNPAVAPWRSYAGRALAAIGDLREAEPLIQAELTQATAFAAPGPIGRALRALASISERDPALEALEAAVETLQGSQAALERAGALVDFGAALRRSRRRRHARQPLMEGLELAQRCGAEVLVAHAQSEMKLAGARPRRTALRGRQALTTREQQVASLAADGLSNREIAETLVVTLKTVEWHLNHTYRKLGVRSRGELRESLKRVD